MTAYATVDDMVSRFGNRELVQATNQESPGSGEINEAMVLKALEDASAFADTYLGAKYAVPISPVPPVLVAVVCDIARYRLCGQAMPESEIVKRYENAIGLLQSVSDGKIGLAGAMSAPLPSSGKSRVSYYSAGRTFGVKKYDGD